MKCVLLFLECRTIEICMDGIHIAQGINQRAFLNSPKDNSCSTAAQGYYSGLHCQWPSAWVMYTQLTLVIYYSAVCILTSAILFRCHEESCSISMDTAEAATHAAWAACTVSLTDTNHFDCVVLLPIPSPSCSLLVEWVTYLWVLILNSDFKAQNPHLCWHSYVYVTEREGVWQVQLLSVSQGC
jgi:hypothetical protein